jgi:hypothetical protein
MVFLSKSCGPRRAGINLWYDGVEISFLRFYDAAFEILDETGLKSGYQIFQESPATTLKGVLASRTTEPTEWKSLI